MQFDIEPWPTVKSTKRQFASVPKIIFANSLPNPVGSETSIIFMKVLVSLTFSFREEVSSLISLELCIVCLKTRENFSSNLSIKFLHDHACKIDLSLYQVIDSKTDKHIY